MSKTRISLSVLERISKANINAAGPRYSPSIDPDAPNLEVPSIIRVIEFLTLSNAYRRSLSEFETDLKDAANLAVREVSEVFRGRNSTPDRLVELLQRLRGESAGKSIETLRQIRRTVDFAGKILDRCLTELRTKRQRLERYSNEESKLAAQVNSLEKVAIAVTHLSEAVHGRNFQLILNNLMFMTGEWGTGKTHTLADIAQRGDADGRPVLFILGHRIPAQKNILQAICRSNKIQASPSEFLAGLNKLGKKKNCRALLIVDGINEGDRSVWRDGIAEIAERIARYPNIGLILSCRSPFERQILNYRTRKNFVEVMHEGFQEIEFDAQKEFFNYYDIPIPHFPLLTPEFSRPLFLKIMCETIRDLGKRAKSDRIRKVASGQKGMTKMLEDFVKEIGAKIERDYALSVKTCWNILKGVGKGSAGGVVGVAPLMATRLADHITLSDLRRIVNGFPGVPIGVDADGLCHRMITDGLIVEDSIWKDGVWQAVIRLPYQRFSDHIICRHLIENYLDVSSEQSIRRSFYKNQPLGKIFELDKWERSYAMPGLASALTLEFPERVRRVVGHTTTELVDYLPKKRRLAAPYSEVFLEGLLWRDASSFTNRTNAIARLLIENDVYGSRRETIETLVCLASRPQHPINAEWILAYLRPMPVAGRDRLWSEFLRNSDRESAVRRLLDWVEGPGRVAHDEGIAENLIRLCSLFLTTTDRPLRDRVTKALVLVGEKSPSQLFGATIESMDFNDPYVSERLLAACYGVLMRSWAFPDKILLSSVVPFSKNLYDSMFAAAAPFATKHFLARDYGLGILTLARKIVPNCLGSRPIRRLSKPFDSPDPMPAATSISDADVLAADSAFHMDFANYTIGGLVSGRANYDSTNEEYAGVLRQIKWRVLDLGYDQAKFADIDMAIDNASYYREYASRSEKIDRYGKKYSWIAYFEMSGMRADRGILPNVDDRPRVAECDIDPSFPAETADWKPPLKGLFRSKFTTAKRWAASGPSPSYEGILTLDNVDDMPGPWVLLDGFIQEVSAADPRKIFTFIRGLLIPEPSVEKFAKMFLSKDYPGNRQIPDPSGDYYTFAGEVPWSRSFGLDLRTSRGKARRHLAEAFESWQQRTVRKRFDKLTESEKLHLNQDFDLDSLIARVNGKEPVLPTEDTTPAHVNLTKYVMVGGIQVELPLHDFGWESYHSTENQLGNVKFVAPALCDFLGLKNRGENVDLYDSEGKPASRFRRSGGIDDFQSRLLYLSKDLLDAYLDASNQVIVWAVWGERDFKNDLVEKYRLELQPVWNKYGHIHRKLFWYRPGIVSRANAYSSENIANH